MPNTVWNFSGCMEQTSYRHQSSRAPEPSVAPPGVQPPPHGYHCLHIQIRSDDGPIQVVYVNNENNTNKALADLI